MNIFLLWFSIFSFTIFCIALFPAVIGYRQRGNRKPDLYYLQLMISYCLWLIIFSFLFFSDIFVSPVSVSFRTVFGLLRALVTALVLILYPSIIISSSKKYSGKLSPLVLIAPVVYSVLIIPVFLYGSMLFVRIVTVSFNIYMLAVLLSSIKNYRPDRILRGANIRFLIKLSLCYHGFSLVFYLVPAALIPQNLSLLIAVVPRALFCLIWGLYELVSYIRREYRKEKEGAVSVKEAFTKDFGITAREKDVIGCIRRGYRHRQIAGSLFISEKTVETHIYSIYRKCGVNNKVELINLLDKY